MKQFVYIMQCGDGYHKIGRSHKPEVRRRQLVTSRANDDINILYVCGPFNDAGKIENGAHAILKHCRMSGEWFDCTYDEALAAVMLLESSFQDSPDSSGEIDMKIGAHLAQLMLDPFVKAIEEARDTAGQALKVIQMRNAEIDRLESELIEATRIIDSYSVEAKDSHFLTRRALSALDRKDKEIAKLRAKLAEIQHSLLN